MVIIRWAVDKMVSIPRTISWASYGRMSLTSMKNRSNIKGEFSFLKRASETCDRRQRSPDRGSVESKSLVVEAIIGKVAALKMETGELPMTTVVAEVKKGRGGEVRAYSNHEGEKSLGALVWDKRT